MTGPVDRRRALERLSEEHSERWVTLDDVQALEPCYSVARLHALARGRTRVRLRTIARMYDVPVGDRLWVLVRLVAPDVAVAFARWCSAHAGVALPPHLSDLSGTTYCGFVASAAGAAASGAAFSVADAAARAVHQHKNVASYAAYNAEREAQCAWFAGGAS
jgi:hypothetical protein